MSRRSIGRILGFGVLAVALAGCQDRPGIMEPATEPAVLSAAQAGNNSGIVQDRSANAGGVTAVIDASGGVLSLGNQELVVPAGAVDAPTTFNMRKHGGALRVTLTASREALNDVGSAGFNEPLSLSFHYGNEASLQGDPSELQIVWIRPDGSFEPQPTTVDTEARVVTGEISHFSDYALATS